MLLKLTGLLRAMGKPCRNPTAKNEAFFSLFYQHLCSMKEHFKHIIRAISKGDTRLVESFFRRPGGRKYLENITLILINTLPHTYHEKQELYLGFVEVLDRMEQRIRRQNEGQEILNDVFQSN